MSFNVGDTVVLKSKYYDDNGDAEDPTIPVKVFVRRVGEEERQEFTADKVKTGVFQLEYAETDSPGTYYYRIETSGGDVTQGKFKVEQDKTRP
jgi:hypothetical protein